MELDTQPNEVTLVLEECGTEVDDDEVLTEFAGMSKVFMLLKKGRSWTKEQEGSADESAPRSVVTCSNPVNECAPVLDQLSQSQTERIGKDCPNTGSASASELTPQPRELVTYHTPLPVFTDYVKCKLTDGFSKEVWGKMINQAAEYYLSKFPRIGESSEYQSIGEKMYRAYPSILSEGRNPWALFCKDLSQRIRWLRWSRNKKSNLGKSINNSGQPPEKVFRMENMKRTASPAVSLESTSIDYDKNVEALQQEHHERQPGDTSIKALVTINRQKIIQCKLSKARSKCLQPH